MLKLSKITLDPGEIVLCDNCKEPLTDELAETSVMPGHYHQACASWIENQNDQSDVMAFMFEAQEYAKSKGE